MKKVFIKARLFEDKRTGRSVPTVFMITEDGKSAPSEIIVNNFVPPEDLKGLPSCIGLALPSSMSIFDFDELIKRTFKDCKIVMDVPGYVWKSGRMQRKVV